MSEDVLVRVEHVSKKFCRSLKRSLWYGLKDLGGEIVGQTGKDRLQLRRDEFLAIDDVSFELRRGECLGLIGANGAGKSTLLRMLNGLIRPDAGRIAIMGQVGGLIELGAGFNPVLTGRENVYVNGAVLGLTRQEVDARFDEILEFSELEDFIDSPVQAYSSGMAVRLGFAVAAHLRPNVLLIDEVLAVGDLHFRMKCFRHVLELKSSGSAIILVSHSMTDIARVCDEVLLLDQGSLQFRGTVQQGIVQYQKGRELRRVQSQTGSSSSPRDPRIGAVRVKNSRGELKNEFQTGETIALDIELLGDCKRSVRLVAHIESPVAPLGSISTPQSNFQVPFCPPRTRIRLLLERIPLLLGHYSVSIGLNGSEKGKVLDLADQAASFQIIAPPTDSFGFGESGLIRFLHRWELID